MSHQSPTDAAVTPRGDDLGADQGEEDRDFGASLSQASVVVCCGPGGVGKTTVSAALGVEAARRGRRACVVTVDPARRLADALGIESLTNSPVTVAGPWPGELQALMLDARGTFDELVHRYSQNEEQAQEILSNRLYQSLSGALSGTQEYMAMEKLYELTQEDRYDLVVVDTPPTRNALELLEAPSRLTNFLENRLFRALLLPTRAYLKAVGVATRALLRTISKVAGAEIVNDAVTFFQAFQGMEEGFRTRASSVRDLLNDPQTGYLLVTSPRADAIEEATFFAERLQERAIVPIGLVANRVNPHFWPPGRSEAEAVIASPPDKAFADVPADSALGPLVDSLLDMEAVAEREDAVLSALGAQVEPSPLVRVPLLGSDIHDLDGLQILADQLFRRGDEVS